MTNPKRFDDFTGVDDCNNCAHYWDNSCDGVSEGSTKPCNSFLATRSVVIPSQINDLQRRIKWLSVSCALIELVVIIHLIAHIMGWYGG